MIDRPSLQTAIDRVNTKMRSHAGGIELVAIEGDTVVVAFTGLCCGCPARPLTWLGTIERSLLAVDGVGAVEAPGVRISDEARARLQDYVDGPRR